MPDRDLILSPQHRVLISSKIVERMYDEPEVLVPVKKLVGVPGIQFADDVLEVEYIHFLCQNHEIVFANDTPCETLLCGKQALRTIGDKSRAEIFSLFPNLMADTSDVKPARLIAHGTKLKNCVARHVSNSQRLLNISIRCAGENSEKTLSSS